MSKITLHRAQAEPIHWLFSPLDPNSLDWKMRFCLFVGSRGLGKSYTSAAAVAAAVGELEALPRWVPNKNITILCGSSYQVKNVYWPLLSYVFNFEKLCKGRSSFNEGHFKFPNGTTVQCWSVEAVERLRGSGQYLIVADEMTTWTIPNSTVQDAWESVIEPTIVTRWSPKQARAVGAKSPGRALIPSTPMGFDYFYDLSNRQIVDDRWKTFHYTYRDSPLLDPEEIEKQKRVSDPVKFAREYEASFEDSGLNVFYCFKRKTHVRTDLEPFAADETVHCAIDFNIALNCTTFHAIRGNQLHALDEHRGSANTEELARVIRAKFPTQKIICYPDPSGAARKTSAPIGQTDFTILRNAGFTVLSRTGHPPVVDSVAAVNSKLLNAKGEVEFFVSSKCQGLINSFERTVWVESKAESAVIDKSQGVEHFTDGVRYLVEYLWPTSKQRPTLKTGFGF